MPSLRVLDPGLHATVQDLGRRGHAHEGVPESGAADPVSLRVGNRLAGNADDAAAIELTLRGGLVRFDDAALVVLAGAAMDASVVCGAAGGATRMDLPLCTPTAVTSGSLLRLGAALGEARTYLCVRGGIDVPVVMGARATHPSAGFGGHEGRPLRAGDTLGLGAVAATTRASSRPLADDAAQAIAAIINRRTLRVIRGPHAELLGPAAWASFTHDAFLVSSRSNRMGTRLERGDRASGRSLSPSNSVPPRAPGPASDSDRSRGRLLPGRLPSEGAPWGAVQFTESGELIALGPDHPTTGGYPMIATVIGADLPALGQLAPGARVRFEEIDVNASRRIWAEQEQTIRRLVPAPSERTARAVRP